MIPNDPSLPRDKDSSELNRLLGRIEERIAGQAREHAETRQQLGSIKTTLDRHTVILGEQTRQLGDLESAITVSGILRTGKAWAPMVAIIATAVAGLAWLSKHFQWSP